MAIGPPLVALQYVCVLPVLWMMSRLAVMLPPVPMTLFCCGCNGIFYHSGAESDIYECLVVIVAIFVAG